MHRAGPAVLAAAGLYRAASGFLFVPLMQQIWSLTLRFAPMHYLNNSNASDIFTSPAIVGCIAAIAVLTAFWALYGFSILLHGLDRARRGETLRLLPLLGDSLRDIAHAWLPQNWLILIYSALLIPFTSFFLASDYITQLAVPEYILGVIRANARYHALYLAGALVLLALWVGGALVLPLFVLERKSLWQAARESFDFVRGRFFRVFLLLTRWNLSVAVGAALRLLAVAVPLYGIILAVGLESTQAMFAMSRAALVVELPFIFKDNETAWNFLDGDIMKEVTDGLYDTLGYKVLAWGEGGFRNILSQKPIRTPADLKGMKIRVPGMEMFMTTFQTIGAAPSALDFNETFTAVQQHLMDGLELPIASAYTGSYYEICDYYDMTGHFYNAISLSCSKSFWESLSPELQEIFLTAAKEAGAEQRTWLQTAAADMLSKMEDGGGTIIDDVDVAAFQEACAPVYEAYRDKIGSDLLDRAVAAVQ